MVSHCKNGVFMFVYKIIIPGELKPDMNKKFQPRRIMCRHCISNDEFWLNNAVKSYNNKINKKYSVKF